MASLNLELDYMLVYRCKHAKDATAQARACKPVDGAIKPYRIYGNFKENGVYFF